jgi:uncharacterized protein YdiU (UPF0061 family)
MLDVAMLTMYSRRTGPSAARPSPRRENEAMAALGIPTTRALAAVTTGEPVWREMLLFKNCNPQEPRPDRAGQARGSIF